MQRHPRVDVAMVSFGQHRLLVNAAGELDGYVNLLNSYSRYIQVNIYHQTSRNVYHAKVVRNILSYNDMVNGGNGRELESIAHMKLVEL